MIAAATSSCEALRRWAGPLERLSGVARRLQGVTLVQRFAAVCLVILVAGALIIGRWVSTEIERGVIHRTGSLTALYVDSVVSPHLHSLESGGQLSAEDQKALQDLLRETSLGDKIVSFKVWSTDGRVLFATVPGEAGNQYPVSHELRHALGGEVFSHLSPLDEVENELEREQWSQLVETYTPARAADGRVTGVVEFYQLPDELLSEVHRSQQRAWAIVGSGTVVMYVLLVGLVAGASRTITRQTRGLQVAFNQQQNLEQRVRSLNARLRHAAGTKAQTDEEALHRLMQELHDGPTQDLSLALLRFDGLRSPDTARRTENVEALEFAVRHAHDEIRNIMAGLRLPDIDGLGWAETVAKAISEHELRTGSTVHFEADAVASEPTPEQRIGVYRVVQEALSNATRHGGRDEEWVMLTSGEGFVQVEIRDEGNGFEVAAVPNRHGRRARIGLRSMRERAELLGGELDVRSTPGAGTTVTVRLPLSGEVDDA